MKEGEEGEEEKGRAGRKNHFVVPPPRPPFLVLEYQDCTYSQTALPNLVCLAIASHVLECVFLSSGVPSPSQAQAILSTDLFVVDFITHFPLSCPSTPSKPRSPFALSPPAQHTTHPERELEAVVFFWPRDPSRDHTSTLLGKRARSPPPLGFLSMVCAARDARFPKGCPSLA